MAQRRFADFWRDGSTVFLVAPDWEERPRASWFLWAEEGGGRPDAVDTFYAFAEPRRGDPGPERSC